MVVVSLPTCFAVRPMRRSWKEAFTIKQARTTDQGKRSERAVSCERLDILPHQNKGRIDDNREVTRVSIIYHQWWCHDRADWLLGGIARQTDSPRCCLTLTAFVPKWQPLVHNFCATSTKVGRFGSRCGEILVEGFDSYLLGHTSLSLSLVVKVHGPS
jgi:hypothetical protein